MTSRATGRLRAVYHSRGRKSRFAIAIPRRPGGKPSAWTVRRRLPPSQRGKRTGILTLSYAGDARVRPDRLRTRVAPRRSRLRRTMTAVDDQGALVARGTVSRSAPGVVRLRLDVADESAVLHYRARIRDGRWALRRLLPSKAARGGQLSIQYTGHHGRRIRGESLSKAVSR